MIVEEEGSTKRLREAEGSINEEVHENYREIVGVLISTGGGEV